MASLRVEDLALHAGVARETVQEFVDGGLLAPDQSGSFIEPVNSGPMVRRDGDFFGTAVNVASRVANVAARGEVVVTESTVSAVHEKAHAFVFLGETLLKNVATPLRLYRAQQMG